MKRINETIEILHKLRDNCPRDKTYDIESLVNHMREELDEILEAEENKDKDNLTEEMGDVLMGLLFIMKVADEKYGIKYDDVLKRLHKKMKFRHSHVFEDPKDISLEKADKIWEERKRLEKENNIYEDYD